MGTKWSEERIWKWYNSKPWIRGCNFIGSDCANRIDQWQSYKCDERFATEDSELNLAKNTGFNSIRVLIEYDVWDQEHDNFMANLERRLALADSNNMTVMMVMSNECCVPKEFYKKNQLGEQHYDLGYHGGRKISPHQSGMDTYSIIDEPEIADRYLEMVKEIITKYKDDERIIAWNLMNEPGNRRKNKSMEFLKRLFKVAREIDPIQPLAADVWGRVNEDGYPFEREIEVVALENSDFISFHCYENFSEVVKRVTALKKHNRPIMCTEWLCRVKNNNIHDIFPFFYAEKIGSYHWGLVASYKTQYFEPYNRIWEDFENENIETAHLKVKEWFHDIYRPSHHPYDPTEIKIIKEFTALSDREYEKATK